MLGIFRAFSILNSKLPTFTSILSSQNGTEYTHTLNFKESIYNFKVIYVDSSVGVIQLYNLNGTLKVTDIARWSNAHRTVDISIGSVSSDGESIVLKTDDWLNTNSNQGAI